MRRSLLVAIAIVFVCCTKTSAQTPGILYTWAGTGNVHDWVGGDVANVAVVTNSTAGQLTVMETGDPVDPFDPGLAHVIRDGFNRRLESSTQQGGLDVWGLDAIEIDLQHNGTGNIDVQFFVQATPNFNYIWAGSDGTLNGPDFSVGPGLQTLQFPLDLLTSAQQSYIRTIGLSVRDHISQGNVTWDIFEVRSTGTAPTVRELATHDVGTSDNGLNGAYVNFDATAVAGNSGAQNQDGLSHNTAGTGSLQWTDLGGSEGAAISWGNGTLFDGNSFNERLTDVSNYDTVTFRMSASGEGTEPIGVQGWFQTGSFNFQVAGGSGFSQSLPLDGQFYDLVFPLSSVTNRQNTQTFGINLFAHPNDAVINVDLVRFDVVAQIPGDYNQDGKVDAADYVVWRKNPSAFGGQLGYDEWVANFGSGSGSGATVEPGAVPEPSAAALLLTMVVAGIGTCRWTK